MAFPGYSLSALPLRISRSNLLSGAPEFAGRLARSLACLLILALAFATTRAHALQPYLAADKVEGESLEVRMALVERKLTGAGFTVLGRHLPAGLGGATLVVTDPDLLAALANTGGSDIVAAPIRVAVMGDGRVSSINPEYWARAFVAPEHYARVEGAVAGAARRLHEALHTGKPFGGEVAATELPRYHYMFGMERFADRALVREMPGFDAALATVNANLGAGVAGTSKVYQLVLVPGHLAVVGFAQNDPAKGEAWWVKRIDGEAHLAALPWEVFIVDGKIYGLYARYRTALAWPELGMGQFMTIVNHPDATLATVRAIAGVKE